MAEPVWFAGWKEDRKLVELPPEERGLGELPPEDRGSGELPPEDRGLGDPPLEGIGLGEPLCRPGEGPGMFGFEAKVRKDGEYVM